MEIIKGYWKCNEQVYGRDLHLESRSTEEVPREWLTLIWVERVGDIAGNMKQSRGQILQVQSSESE